MMYIIYLNLKKMKETVFINAICLKCILFCFGKNVHNAMPRFWDVFQKRKETGTHRNDSKVYKTQEQCS